MRVLGFVCLAAGCAAATITEQSTDVQVIVSTDGSYHVLKSDLKWRFSGRVGSLIAKPVESTGTDGIGWYQEITFEWKDGQRRGTIRTYRDRPVVLFSSTHLIGGDNDTVFPEFTHHPRYLSHLTYEGAFASHRINVSIPESPWLFFDNEANSFILAPAANFGVWRMGIGEQGQLRSEIHPDLKTLPEGFTVQTLLVMDHGINLTMESWGAALTDLKGKTRPANDADVSLNRIGYWTDAGASYYYRFEQPLGCERTLLGVKEDFDRAGIALGYMQLDSWFYPKGRDAEWTDYRGGIHRYEAHRALFPESLAEFSLKLGLPLVTHSRWIDEESPYRRQYRMSNHVSTDRLYWDNLARYLRESGVSIYEQDWLSTKAQSALNLDDRRRYLDEMSRALAENGINIQYCMPLPRHFLQSSKYNNVTTIRVSEDRFDRNRWEEFLFGSRLASALGLWPFSDVFMSAEADNLLLATLSAGPVGVGDSIGMLHRDNLLQAVRADGVIVKPDTPAVPLDETYVHEARRMDRPMIAAAYTTFGPSKVAYVFAFPRKEETALHVSPALLGFTRPVYLYDFFADSGRLLEIGETFETRITKGKAYFVVVPVGDSGMAFLGDSGHFVPLGRKRIAEFSDDGAIQSSVSFAPREASRTLHGYAPHAPIVEIQRGGVTLSTYDEGNKRFRITVTPDEGLTAVVRIVLP